MYCNSKSTTPNRDSLRYRVGDRVEYNPSHFLEFKIIYLAGATATNSITESIPLDTVQALGSRH